MEKRGDMNGVFARLCWRRLLTAHLLLLGIVLFSVVRIYGVHGGLLADVSVGLWSFQLVSIILIGTLFPSWGGRIAASLCLTAALCFSFWHMASIELYNEQCRPLVFEEVLALWQAEETRGLVLGTLFSVPACLFYVLWFAFFAGINFLLKCFASDVLVAFTYIFLIMIMAIGSFLGTSSGSSRSAFYYHGRPLCAPWSSVHEMRNAEVPVVDSKVARELWVDPKAPFWKERESDADIMKGLHVRYPKRSIVCIMLESHALAYIDKIGVGAEGYAPSSPFVSKLLKEGGLSFEDCYQSGMGTHTAVWSLLSSQPYVAETAYSPHLARLGLITDFQESGYDVSWLQAAPVQFAGFHETLHVLGIEGGMREEENDAVKKLDPEGLTQWGMPDEHLFRCAWERLQEYHSQESYRPYLQCILTQSNHWPYEFPSEVNGVLTKKNHEGGMRYADAQVQAFIERIRTLPESERPLVFITADTSFSEFSTKTFSYKDENIVVNALERLRIPSVILTPDGYGAGQVFSGIFSHEDILPLCAIMTGVSSPLAQRFLNNERIYTISNSEEDIIVLSRTHYGHHSGWQGHIQRMWGLEQASQQDDRLADVHTYLASWRKRIWTRSPGARIATRPMGWHAIKGGYQPHKEVP